MEYCLITTRNEVLIHTTTQTNFENIILTKESTPRRPHMIPLYKMFRIGKFIEAKVDWSFPRDWRTEGKLGVTANGFFWIDENIPKLIVVIVTQSCEHTKTIELYTFNR